MDKIKVQFIGINNIPKVKDDEIFRARKVKWDTKGYQTDEYLSFYDYHIIFINYPFSHPYPSDPSGFLDYINGGGIVVIFVGYSRDYPWSENFLEVSYGKGNSINPASKHWLNVIFRKHRFAWNCMLSPGQRLELIQLLNDFPSTDKNIIPKEKIFEIVGTTTSGGKCVSAVIHYRKGKLILLPITENPQDMSVDLIRDLLDGIKTNYFKKDEIPEIRPQWIEKCNLQSELKLKGEIDSIISQYAKIKEKLEWYEIIKKILYCHDKELSYSIYLTFKNMGFNADLKEDEGHQDIELKFNSFFAIVEAKGLKEYANLRDLRQLLHYYVTTKENNPNVKGIFIVNHFRDRDLSEREQPYTKDALELAENNGFCLLTTVDLFKIYDKFLDGKLTINQIIDLFKATKGQLIL